MDDNKEKDEIQEMFSRELERRENSEEVVEEENVNENKHYSHSTEIISPIIALVLGIAAIFDKLWFTAYFGLIFAVLGLYICKKKINNISKGIVILNVIALATCFFIGGMWMILYAMAKL